MAGRYTGLDKVKSKGVSRFSTAPVQSGDQRDNSNTADRHWKDTWRRRQRRKELRDGAGWHSRDEQRAQRHPKGLRNATPEDYLIDGTYKA